MITSLEPNQVRDIPNFGGIYGVTQNGEVWSFPKINGKNSKQKGKWLNQYTERTGYKFVFLQKNKTRKLCYIQGLVAKTYLGDFSEKGLQVNHIDGDKQNNNLKNLEWVTPSENIKHSFKNGMSSQKGESNAYSKLTEKDVITIRELANSGRLQKDIAEEMSVSRPTICNIIKRNTWKHL